MLPLLFAVYSCIGPITIQSNDKTCDAERDVRGALKQMIMRSYEQDFKAGRITRSQMMREIRAELKIYKCGWEQ